MTAKIKNNAELVIKIEGMKCFYCFTVVADILREFDGIKEIRVGLNKGNAIVRYDKGKVSSEKLLESLKKAGYNAVPKN